jgi:hypothetical protein
MILEPNSENCRVPVCMYSSCIGKKCEHHIRHSNLPVVRSPKHEYYPEPEPEPEVIEKSSIIYVDIKDVPDDVLIGELERRLKAEE